MRPSRHGLFLSSLLGKAVRLIFFETGQCPFVRTQQNLRIVSQYHWSLLDPVWYLVKNPRNAWRRAWGNSSPWRICPAPCSQKHLLRSPHQESLCMEQLWWYLLKIVIVLGKWAGVSRNTHSGQETSEWTFLVCMFSFQTQPRWCSPGNLPFVSS